MNLPSSPVPDPSTDGTSGTIMRGTPTPSPVATATSVSSPPAEVPPLAPPVVPTPDVLPSPQPVSPSSIRLFVEPADGPHPVIDAIHNAQQSVWLEMYLLQYQKVIDALIAAHGRNCDVRVLLEPNPQGQTQNIPSAQLLAQLQAAGIMARTSNPHFHPYTHAKVMLIDGGVPQQATAYIMSTNFTGQALGDSTWNPLNRDYGILTTDPQVIQDVMAIFTTEALGAGNNSGKRNRELGIIVDDAGVVQRLINTFEADWQACQN